MYHCTVQRYEIFQKQPNISRNIFKKIFIHLKKLRTFCGKLRTFCGKLRTFVRKQPPEPHKERGELVLTFFLLTFRRGKVQ